MSKAKDTGFWDRLLHTRGGKALVAELEEQNAEQTERESCARRYREAWQEWREEEPSLDAECEAIAAKVEGLRAELRQAVADRARIFNSRARRRLRAEHERRDCTHYLRQTADAEIDRVIELLGERIDSVRRAMTHGSVVAAGPFDTARRAPAPKARAEIAELKNAAQHELPRLKLVPDQASVRPTLDYWRARAAGEAAGQKPALATTNGNGRHP